MTTLCFCRWTGAAVRVGFDNEESRPFLNLRVASARGEPMVRNLLRLLSPFGPEGQMNRALPRLTPSAAATEKARAILGSGVAPVIVFAASHWRKSWPLESFLRVATALTDRGHRVMLAFGPGDGRISDAAARAWERNSGGKGAVLPPQDPPCWLALLAGCRLFLSNDCGPYHLAVAAGASCVTAFVSQDALRDFSHVHEGRLAAFHEPRGEDAERKMIEKSLECLERAG